MNIIKLAAWLIGACWAITYSVFNITTEDECAAYGYRHYKVTWDFDRYCALRLDGSDTLKPLSEVRNVVGSYTWPEEEE